MSCAARFLDARQLGLPFPHQPALGREDFIVSTCNTVAGHLIDSWPAWPLGHAAVIIGPSGSGKSHLARVFAARTGVSVLDARSLATSAARAFNDRTRALVVEDVDRGTDEAALLHLFNAMLEADGFVLLTGSVAATRWPLTLPDLVSRVRVLQVAEINQPDDAILPALLGKLFADRQLSVGADALAYLVPRVERSFGAIHTLIEALDRASLSQERAVTVPLIRAILGDFGLSHDEAMKS